jgi:hypothetical protein
MRRAWEGLCGDVLGIALVIYDYSVMRIRTALRRPVDEL